MKEPGYVYILTNPSFREDWVKIGKSSRPVDIRSKELDNTAVPLPFEIFATMKTAKYSEAERLIHRYIERFTKLRIRDNREFFNVKPEVALEIFCDVAMILEDAEIEEIYKKDISGESLGKKPGIHSTHTPARDERITWLISSNVKYYDLAGSLAKFGYVYWSQYFNYQKGDTVYIYSSSPDSCIKYKMAVEAHDLKHSEEMDADFEFYADQKDSKTSQEHNRYAKFKLLDETNSDQLTLAHLMEHGLGMAPRGAVCLQGELLEFIEKNF